MSQPLGQEERDALLSLGVATVYEASALPCALDPAIRAVWPGATVCGTAYPVRCHPGDNLAIHRALEQAPRGAVLVVQAGGHVAGYWGEVLTVAAQQRGIEGLVIDGGIRDARELQRLRFGAFARGIAVYGTVKNVPGDVGSPIVLGGVPVTAGDVVLGDADGVLVLPRAQLVRTLEEGRARAEREAGWLERIRQGELTLDILGLRR